MFFFWRVGCTVHLSWVQQKFSWKKKVHEEKWESIWQEWLILQQDLENVAPMSVLFLLQKWFFSYSSILKISLFQQMQAENYSTSLVVTQHTVPSFFMLWMLFKCFWICTSTGKFDLKLCYDKQYKTDVIGLLVYLWLQC